MGSAGRSARGMWGAARVSMVEGPQPSVEAYGSRASAVAAGVIREAAGNIETTCLSIGVRGSPLERQAAGFDASNGLKFLAGRGATWGHSGGPALEVLCSFFPTVVRSSSWGHEQAGSRARSAAHHSEVAAT